MRRLARWISISASSYSNEVVSRSVFWLVRSVERLTRSSGTGSHSFRFGFPAIELAHDIGANRPRSDLCGLGLPAFAVCALVSRANEAALDEHVRAFLDRSCDVFGEPRAEHA